MTKAQYGEASRTLRELAGAMDLANAAESPRAHGTVDAVRAARGRAIEALLLTSAPRCALIAERLAPPLCSLGPDDVRREADGLDAYARPEAA